MDAFEWSAGIYASALAMAKCMTPTELTRTALVYRSQAVPFDWVPSGTPREPLRAVGTEAGSRP